MASAEHAAPAWRAIADAVGLGPGVRVLDVGCGAGGFVALAAGRGSQTSGIDRVPELVAAARARVPAADLRVGRMEELPWRDATFDVVTGFNAFQYAADPADALGDAHRVLRPGGALAICKWAAPSASDLFLLLEAVRTCRVAAAASLDASGVAALDAALCAGGLQPWGGGLVSTELVFSDLPALVAGLEASGAFPGGLCASDVSRSAAPLEAARGGYRLTNRLVYSIGRRP